MSIEGSGFFKNISKLPLEDLKKNEIADPNLVNTNESITNFVQNKIYENEDLPRLSRDLKNKETVPQETAASSIEHVAGSILQKKGIPSSPDFKVLEMLMECGCLGNIEEANLTEEERGKCAEIFFNHSDPEDFAQNIKAFKLTPPQRFVFAGKIFEKQPLILGWYIHKFKLTHPQRVDFANQILEKSFDNLVRCIEHFRLTKDELFTLFQKIIKNPPVNISHIIENFNLSPSELFDAFKKLFETSPQYLMGSIAKFNLTIEQRFEFVNQIIEKDPYSFFFNTSDDDLDANSTALSYQIQIAHRLMNLSYMQWTSTSIEDIKAAIETYPALSLFFGLEHATQGIIPRLDFTFFDELAEKISKKGIKEQSILLKWLGHTEISRKFYNISEISELGASILEKLIELRSPNLRYKITKILFDVLSNEQTKACLESTTIKQALTGKSAPLFHLLLTPLLLESSTLVDLSGVINILNSRYYEDTEKRKIALSCLATLLEPPSLTSEDKIQTLKVAFQIGTLQKIQEEERSLFLEKDKAAKLPKKNQKESQQSIELKSAEINKSKKNLHEAVNRNLQMIEALINLNHSGKVKEAKTINELETSLQGVFVETTGIDKTENFSKKYLATFASSRNPKAIFIYAGKLKTLPEEAKAKALSALKIFVESTLNGTLSTFRYQETPEDHLSTVFKGRADLKNLWMQGDKRNLSEYIGSDKEPSSIQQFNVLKRLHQCVCLDAHILANEFQFLTDCLEDPSKLEEKQATLNKAIKSEHDPKELNRLRLQQGLLLLLASNEPNAEKSKIFTSFVETLIDTVFPEPHQFKQDLKDLGEALLAKEQTLPSLEGWIIADTDDPQDLFLCGTEVPLLKL